MVQDETEDAEEGGGIPAELVKSYVAFGIHAIKRRKALGACLFLSIALLTFALGKLWPRVYHCETRLIAQQSQVLSSMRGDSVNDALRGASDIVLRRENLEAIVRKLDLVRAMAERRVLVRRARDAILAKLRPKPSEKDALEGMIWTLGTKLTATVSPGDATLTLAIDWPDAGMSAAILQAALDNFLETRHVAEVSTIEEYVSILEGHTRTIRDEIDQIAKQLTDLKKEHRAAILNKRKKALADDSGGASVRRVVMQAPRHLEPDAQLPTLKSALEAKQRQIAQLEDYRNRRLQDLQSKLADLRSKYTSAHPAVLDVEQNIAAASHESSQVTSLREEVRNLQSQIDARGAAAHTAGAGSAAVTGGATTTAAPLPPSIMDLVQDTNDDLDPAVEAQLRYAVEKYTNLRSEISNSRIELDTAQAAFKFRYKIVLPPEIPKKAIKPKVPLILGAGLFLALLAGLFVPVLFELKSGLIVERWQVNELKLPVLGELRFPPRSSGDDPKS